MNYQGANQGRAPMLAAPLPPQALGMSRYLLEHRHPPDECGVVFASFKGHQTPLRHKVTLASCRSGGHAIWWTVDAASEVDAMRLLPSYVVRSAT
jgi:hypothetical protein